MGFAIIRFVSNYYTYYTIRQKVFNKKHWIAYNQYINCNFIVFILGNIPSVFNLVSSHCGQCSQNTAHLIWKTACSGLEKFSSLNFRSRTHYTNNIHGWLTDAKTSYQYTPGSDLPFYAFALTYNNVLYAAQYSNGNISSMQWRGKDENSFSKGLNFTYDNANRLLQAIKPPAAIYIYIDTESGIT